MNQLVRIVLRATDTARMREGIQVLLDLVRRHLAREEQLLFGLARQALPDGSESIPARTGRGFAECRFRSRVRVNRAGAGGPRPQ